MDRSTYLPRRLKLHDFIQTRHRLDPYLTATPLRYSQFLSHLSGAEVWLKLESQQPTGSFKVRGALNKLRLLIDSGQAEQVVTASAGNHGLGLAYAASQLNFEKVTVFLPETTPGSKIEKLGYYPVQLYQVGQTYEAAHQAAEEFALKTGAHYISAYNDVDIVLGQGTCGLEVLLDLPDVDLIYVPTGGGGLLSGIALVCKAINPLTKIIGIQPEASPAARLSLEQKQPIDPFDHGPTIADGLAGGFGAIPFYLAGALVETVLLYDEAAIRRSVFTLLNWEKLVVEASGAIAIAPLLEATESLQGQTVVCILTGSNVDSSLLVEIMADLIADGTTEGSE